MKRWFLCVNLFCFLHLGVTYADVVEKRKPVLVTATRFETPLSEVTQSYTLISSDDIQTIRETAGLEVLRDVPGVAVVRNGTVGANATTFLRGANSNQTLVMIDGIEVNSPTVGSFDFSYFPTDNIDRIEVIRGPQSTLYGSEAMGGVINIITKKGEGPARFTLDTEGGSNETWRGYVNASGSQNIFDYALSSSYLTTDGEFDNDAYENLNVAGNFGIAVNPEIRVDLITRLVRARKEIQDFGLTDQDINRFNKSENELIGLRFNTWAADFWNQILTISYFHDQLLDRDPLDPGDADPVLRSDITGEIFTVESQNHFYWGDLQTITLGFEYEHSNGENKTIGDPFSGDFHFEEDIDNFAVYLQDQVNIQDKFIIVPGIRVDENSVFGTEATPKISAAYWILAHTKLKAGFSRGFRAPSVNELVFPAFGSPDLEAEKSNGWEAGFEQTFFEEKAGVDVVYFRNDFDDLIDFEVISTDPFIGRANNISEAKTEGVEFNSYVQLCEYIKLKGVWTYLDAENEITGEELARRPKNTGVLQAEVNWQKLTFVVTALWVDERRDFDTTLDSYTKVDAALSYHWNDHVTPYVRVENLLDEDYEEAEGFPAPGIIALAGVKAEI